MYCHLVNKINFNLAYQAVNILIQGAGKLVILSASSQIKRRRDLMYVEKLTLSRSFAFCRVQGSSEPHELHVHDCLEVGVLLKEEVEYKFGDRMYRGQPGDVFLCRPFEPHWSFALPGKQFESILVLFVPSL